MELTEEEQWKEVAEKQNKILFMALRCGDLEVLEKVLETELPEDKQLRKMVSNFLQLAFTRMEKNEAVVRGLS